MLVIGCGLTGRRQAMGWFRVDGAARSFSLSLSLSPSLSFSLSVCLSKHARTHTHMHTHTHTRAHTHALARTHKHTQTHTHWHTHKHPILHFSKQEGSIFAFSLLSRSPCSPPLLSLSSLAPFLLSLSIHPYSPVSPPPGLFLPSFSLFSGAGQGPFPPSLFLPSSLFLSLSVNLVLTHSPLRYPPTSLCPSVPHLLTNPAGPGPAFRPPITVVRPRSGKAAAAAASTAAAADAEP